VGYFLIVDFPELSRNSWHFLNEREAAYVVARIEKDRADAIPEPFRIGAYLRNALDMKVWGFAWLFMLTTTNSYAIAYFLPIMLVLCFSNEGILLTSIVSVKAWASPWPLHNASLRPHMSLPRSSCLHKPTSPTRCTSGVQLSSSTHY
jgi:hypothetical protein